MEGGAANEGAGKKAFLRRRRAEKRQFFNKIKTFRKVYFKQLVRLKESKIVTTYCILTQSIEPENKFGYKIYENHTLRKNY